LDHIGDDIIMELDTSESIIEILSRNTNEQASNGALLARLRNIDGESGLCCFRQEIALI
jgi:hypothetical protein